MNEQEIQDVLDELNEVRPEVLNNKAKRLFEAIMKIADDRDKANKRVDELINEVTIKQCELEKKDKIIDKMAEYIAPLKHGKGVAWTQIGVKEYFTKKVEVKEND